LNFILLGYRPSKVPKMFTKIAHLYLFSQLKLKETLLNLLSFSTDAKPDADRYESLLMYLNELISVKDEQSAEIVKFLQAILDKLIDILLDLRTKHTKDLASISEKTLEIHSKQIQPRVFEILVAIFQIIENQNKFASFRTVIDAYLSKNFCTTLAHRPLLRIFNDMMNSICDKYSNWLNNANAANMSHTLNGNLTITSLTNTPQISHHPDRSESSNMFNQTPTLQLSSSNNGSGSVIVSKSKRQSEMSNATDTSSKSNTRSSSSSIQQSEEKESESVINTIKSMEYIFKFAFRSRELLSLYNRSNNPQSDLKSDTFDADIANIFAKLTEIATLNPKGQLYNPNNTNSMTYDAGCMGVEANLTKIQSFILKNLISLLPILIQSKRYPIGRISEFYIGFLQSRFILQTQFLSKFIRTKLFENQGNQIFC
jgi:hypothetical protein